MLPYYTTTARFGKIQSGFTNKKSRIICKIKFSRRLFRKSKIERSRYYEISRGSVIEIDAAIEVIYDLNLLSFKEMEILGKLLNKCFAMLTKLIG
jgi:hypothetical protein